MTSSLEALLEVCQKTDTLMTALATVPFDLVDDDTIEKLESMRSSMAEAKASIDKLSEKHVENHAQRLMANICDNVDLALTASELMLDAKDFQNADSVKLFLQKQPTASAALSPWLDALFSPAS